MTASLFFRSAAVAALLTGAAQAQDNSFAIGAGVSSLGLQVQGVYDAGQNFDVRGFLAGGFSTQGDETIDGVDYAFDGSIRGLGVLVDYFPLRTGVHLSGGVVLSSSSLTASARGDGVSAITIGDTVYGSTSDGVDLDISFQNDIAPLLSLGYRAQASERWSFGAELGAIFIGGIDVQGEAVGNVSQDDVDREIADAEEEFDGANVYPFISLTANYRF